MGRDFYWAAQPALIQLGCPANQRQINMNTPETTGKDHVITSLLLDWRDGDLTAYEQLVPLVYDQLHRIAQRQMSKERREHTLQPSALVNEAFMRLIDYDHVNWQNRQHFFSLAAKMMREVLVNYAEQQETRKRGGDAVRVAFDDSALCTQASHDEVLDLDRALVQLEQDNPRRCRIAECRLFGGMTVEEIAMALELSPATVKREWTVASAQLFRHLQSG